MICPTTIGVRLCRGTLLTDFYSHVIQREYCLSVMRPRQWYSVKRRREISGPDGAPQIVDQQDIFQVLAVQTMRARAKVMPTAESHLDTDSTAPLALNIQRYSVWREPTPEHDALVVFCQDDLEWVTPDQIAPFANWRRHLTKFTSVSGRALYPHCMDLAGAEPAVPTLPLTDPRCPTWSILDELRRLGWRLVVGRVVHSDTLVGTMESKEAVSRKSYFQVLLDLPTYLRQTSVIPSDQPVAFFQVLVGRADCRTISRTQLLFEGPC